MSVCAIGLFLGVFSGSISVTAEVFGYELSGLQASGICVLVFAGLPIVLFSNLFVVYLARFVAFRAVNELRTESSEPEPAAAPRNIPGRDDEGPYAA